jgi:hypothetical protein
MYSPLAQQIINIAIAGFQEIIVALCTIQPILYLHARFVKVANLYTDNRQKFGI